MCELFKNIHVIFTEPKPYDYQKERQFLLTYIGGEYNISKTWSKPYPITIPLTRKEANNKEMIRKKTFKKKTNIGMTGDSKSIGIILSGLLPEVIMWRKSFLYILQNIYIKDKDIICPWVGH